MSGNAWAVPSPHAKYGGALAGSPKATPDDTALNRAAGPAPGRGPLDPREPLLWFGIIAAASVGLMAYSTTVRVGPAEVSASLGKK